MLILPTTNILLSPDPGRGKLRMQESLGGNARTTMLVNIAAVQEHAHETLQSLQFASRAMNVRVKPQVRACFAALQPC